MLTAIGRASVQRVLVRGSALATATPSFVRAVAPASRTFTTSLWSRSPTASEKSATKTKKAKTTTAKKTAAKPKTAEKKVAKKKKAAPKPKPKKVKVKKVLTPDEKLKKDIRELKVKGLFKKEPKMLPDTKWTVFTSANVTGGTRLIDQMAIVSREFKSLSESEMQSLIDTAAENKIANETAYKAWVESYSPREIYDANVARRTLRRKAPGKFALRNFTIRDERQPKGPQHAFSLYMKSRWATGDLTGKIADSAKQVAEDFKNLDPAERKAYDDLAAADLARYAKESQDILGRDVRSSSVTP